MVRTQIYLSKSDVAALAKESRKTGRSKSDLIRLAIAERYAQKRSGESLASLIAETAGVWKRAPEPRAFVESMRSAGRLRPK